MKKGRKSMRKALIFFKYQKLVKYVWFLRPRTKKMCELLKLHLLNTYDTKKI